MAAEPLLSAEEKATEKVRFGNFEVMNDPEGVARYCWAKAHLGGLTKRVIVSWTLSLR